MSCQALLERVLPALLAVLALLLVPCADAAASSACGSWTWQPLAAPLRGGAATAVAVDRSRSAPRDSIRNVPLRIAAGSETGVFVKSGANGASFERAAGTRRVRDLAYDGSGTLWIASDGGLWSLTPDGRLQDRSPGSGEAARRVVRVRTRGELVAVATDAGAFVSRAGAAWLRVDSGVPRAPAVGLALGAGAQGGVDLWLAFRTELWRVQLTMTEGRLVPGGARQESIASAPAGAAILDVAMQGQRPMALYQRALAVRADGGAGPARWIVHRPSLPPGAKLARVVAGPRALWLASDRGLLSARDERGVWRRCHPPAGQTPIVALAIDGDRALVASSAGLLGGVRTAAAVGNLASPPRAGSQRRTVRPPDSAVPSARAVQRAAIEHVHLAPAYFASLRRGLARRGWLPRVDLNVDWGQGRDRSRDTDEAFVSGATRTLNDHDRDRSRDFEVGIGLSWDLDRLAYDPESVDLSRERRQVIALRDDVLDEVNQLYFERRRVVAVLARILDPSSNQAEDLGIRVAELDAGLDAWTGGFWMRALHPQSSR